ncbi:restriction endonuclease subunit S [Zhongshania aliphaticivorans]|uniref:restriction endonuclease subunit S n=1 Tax=Zhongshania aliphaticivorans TaxID=1470434 RepID=UPI0012E6AF07|nr:restriction endonuclease subunit S [Zhongshania aliphaticivorans]CAA0120416.1 Restriction enzyme BgcI subunit beta [Zhongshania aliphaticivorans]
MIELQEIFDIKYGNKLDLNKLTLNAKGINFVSRTSKNNGISEIVEEIVGVEPMPKGAISVSLGGTKLLSSFVQNSPFYTAQNVAVLIPKAELTLLEKLYICQCIQHNRFRYSAFGREANRTIKTIRIPSRNEFPKWLYDVDVDRYFGADAPHIKKSIDLRLPDEWKTFRYDELFDIERGRGPRKKELDGTGSTPFITSTDSNNGITGYTSMEPIHVKNTISVNRNGSVAEAFFQPVPFCSTEDVHIFIPKFPLNQYIAMFIITLIKREKYRYNYGRKWGIQRMKDSHIKLPVDALGKPDWSYMEKFVKSLKFSGCI